MEVNIIKLIANEYDYQHRIDIPTRFLGGNMNLVFMQKKSGMNFIRLRVGLMGYRIVFNLFEGTVSGSETKVASSI